MSILLNLPMPKNCDECPCNDDNWRCGATGEYFDYDDMYAKRRDDCPLIEVPTPHGRLVDIKSVEDGKFTTVSNEYQRWWNGALDSVVDNAPTVIEAEGSETE